MSTLEQISLGSLFILGAGSLGLAVWFAVVARREMRDDKAETTRRNDFIGDQNENDYNAAGGHA